MIIAWAVQLSSKSSQFWKEFILRADKTYNWIWQTIPADYDSLRENAILTLVFFFQFFFSFANSLKSSHLLPFKSAKFKYVWSVEHNSLAIPVFTNMETVVLSVFQNRVGPSDLLSFLLLFIRHFPSFIRGSLSPHEMTCNFFLLLFYFFVILVLSSLTCT